MTALALLYLIASPLLALLLARFIHAGDLVDGVSSAGEYIVHGDTL